MKFVVIILGITMLVTALSQGTDTTPEQYWITGIILTWMGILKD